MNKLTILTLVTLFNVYCYAGAESLQECACRCDGFRGLFCPTSYMDNGYCADFDYEFKGYSEEQCKGLAGGACKGYTGKEPGLYRGILSDCALVAKAKLSQPTE